MGSNIKQVNVEELVTDVKREIKEKGYVNDDVIFSDIPVPFFIDGVTHSKETEVILEALRTDCEVDAYRPLRSNRALGFLIIAFRKILRKLMKFYVEPIVDSQNENNKLITICLHDLYIDAMNSRDKIRALEDEISKIKDSLDS